VWCRLRSGGVRLRGLLVRLRPLTLFYFAFFGVCVLSLGWTYWLEFLAWGGGGPVPVFLAFGWPFLFCRSACGWVGVAPLVGWGCGWRVAETCWVPWGRAWAVVCSVCMPGCAWWRAGAGLAA